MACGALAVPVHGELVTAGLVLRLEANAGVTLASGTSTVTQWNNQVTGVAGAPVSFSPPSTSTRPSWLAEVEPSGNPALQFLASKADRLTTGSASAFDSTSLTWMMALRPNTIKTQVFLTSDLNGRQFAWRTYMEVVSGNTWFRNEVRDAGGLRQNSQINATTAFGDQTLDWMILTSVFDKPAGTLQLFITAADGARFSGNLFTGAVLAELPHQLLSLGSSSTLAADMNLGGVLVYNTALSPAQQLASEQYLFNIYAVPEPSAAAFAGIGCLAVALGLARRGRARSPKA